MLLLKINNLLRQHATFIYSVQCTHHQQHISYECASLQLCRYTDSMLSHPNSTQPPQSSSCNWLHWYRRPEHFWSHMLFQMMLSQWYCTHNGALPVKSKEKKNRKSNQISRQYSFSMQQYCNQFDWNGFSIAIDCKYYLIAELISETLIFFLLFKNISCHLFCKWILSNWFSPKTFLVWTYLKRTARITTTWKKYYSRLQ